MSENSFVFKHFIINQDKCAMKVGTDAMILGSFVPADGANRIIDIGTGTGILALMLAQRCRANIDAIEIDKDAYIQSNENIKNSSWNNRIMIYHTSIQDFKPDDEMGYDLVISNPPYFVQNFKAGMESGRYNERKSARSFQFLTQKDLLNNGIRLMKPEGKYYLILPFESSTAFVEMAKKAGLYIIDSLDILSKAPQTPVRRILGFSRIEAPQNSGRLIIYDQDGRYTDEYINLTKDYYAVDLQTRKRNSQK